MPQAIDDPEDDLRPAYDWSQMSGGIRGHYFRSKSVERYRAGVTMTVPTPDGQTPDSVWQHKPWWCQPWSIILTAATLVGGSWLLLHRVWVTGLVAVPVLTWMVFFVGIYPKLMADSSLLTPEE
jgi:hypothetical protein